MNLHHYIGCKRNKCHPFNSRQGRWKEQYTVYTGCKKFRIETLRACRRDKMKSFCYVTNIWQVLHFLARGPWRVWHRMVLQKLLKMLGNYIIFIRDILTEMLERMSRYKSGNDYGFSMMGPQLTLPLMSQNTWTMFSTIVGLGGVVQYYGHHVLPISLLWISLSGGDEVFGVRDTDRHSSRAACPCGRSCSIFSWNTIICSLMPAVH